MTITDQEIDAEYARLSTYGRAWTTDRAEGERHIRTLMRELQDCPSPKFTWFRSLPALVRAAKAATGETVIPYFPGRWFAYWCADGFFAVDRGEIQVSPDEAVLKEAVQGFTRANTYWTPFDSGDVYCADGPIRIEVDTDEVLHSATGPAIAWADGEAYYAWHGTWIPAEWITAPDTVDPASALTWPNAEQARCLGEILGWDRVFAAAQTRVLAEDPNPLTGGTLFEAEVSGEVLRFCRVRCGTGRTCVIQVASDAAGPVLDAIAGTYGVAPEVYARLQVRT